MSPSGRSASRNEAWNPFGMSQWIAWLGATSIAAISVMVFIYGTFLTQDSFKTENESNRRYYQRYLENLEKRLDRIENKLDRLK